MSTPKTKTEEISLNASKIKVLAPKTIAKEISQDQGIFDLEIEKEAEFGGVGMGVLSDGTPYLNQRGLGALCGVQNAHIGSISSQWNEDDQKPRIAAIKTVLAKAGYTAANAHVELPFEGRVHFCCDLAPNFYPALSSLRRLNMPCWACDAMASPS